MNEARVPRRPQLARPTATAKRRKCSNLAQVKAHGGMEDDAAARKALGTVRPSRMRSAARPATSSMIRFCDQPDSGAEISAPLPRFGPRQRIGRGVFGGGKKAAKLPSSRAFRLAAVRSHQGCKIGDRYSRAAFRRVRRRHGHWPACHRAGAMGCARGKDSGRLSKPTRAFGGSRPLPPADRETSSNTAGR